MATPFIGSSKERYRQYNHPVKTRETIAGHPADDLAPGRKQKSILPVFLPKKQKRTGRGGPCMQVILSLPLLAIFSQGTIVHLLCRYLSVNGGLEPVHGKWGKINNLVVISTSGEI
jgi:hypothetical protein